MVRASRASSPAGHRSSRSPRRHRQLSRLVVRGCRAAPRRKDTADGHRTAAATARLSPYCAHPPALAPLGRHVTVFMILGGLGLVLLLLSLVVGEVFEEIGFGDGGLSGSSLGIGAVVFGASGVIALSNGLGSGWAYGIAIAFAVVAAGVAQLVITRLASSE